MDIVKLKILLKEYNYVLIDYSEKFKMNIDFNKMNKNKKYSEKILTQIKDIIKTMDDKLIQPKYNNIVFLLDMSKIVKYNSVLFSLLLKHNEIQLEKDVLYLKHSENYMWFKTGEDIKNNIILNFVNQKEKNYECNVCFEDYGSWGNKSSGGTYCGVCDFRTCYKCCIKAQENDLDDSCFGCRTKKTNSFIMI